MFTLLSVSIHEHSMSIYTSPFLISLTIITCEDYLVVTLNDPLKDTFRTVFPKLAPGNLVIPWKCLKGHCLENEV